MTKLTEVCFELTVDSGDLHLIPFIDHKQSVAVFKILDEREGTCFIGRNVIVACDHAGALPEP